MFFNEVVIITIILGEHLKQHTGNGYRLSLDNQIGVGTGGRFFLSHPLRWDKKASPCPIYIISPEFYCVYSFFMERSVKIYIYLFASIFKTYYSKALYLLMIS